MVSEELRHQQGQELIVEEGVPLGLALAKREEEVLGHLLQRGFEDLPDSLEVQTV